MSAFRYSDRKLSQAEVEARTKMIIHLTERGYTPKQISPQVRFGLEGVWKVLRDHREKSK